MGFPTVFEWRVLLCSWVVWMIVIMSVVFAGFGEIVEVGLLGCVENRG